MNLTDYEVKFLTELYDNCVIWGNNQLVLAKQLSKKGYCEYVEYLHSGNYKITQKGINEIYKKLI